MLRYYSIYLFMLLIFIIKITESYDLRYNSMNFHRRHCLGFEPEFKAYEEGLQVQFKNSRGFNIVGFHANINHKINFGDTGEINFDLSESDNENWTYFFKNLDLKPDDIIQYWLYIQKDCEPINCNRLKKWIREIEPSPYIKNTSEKPPNAITNPNSGTNNNCSCCSSRRPSAGTATATSTASAGSFGTSTWPIMQPNFNSVRPPFRGPPALPIPPIRIPMPNFGPQPHLPNLGSPLPLPINHRPQATTSPQVKPTPDSQLCNQILSSGNSCKVADLVSAITKLENAQFTIESLTEVLESLLDETKVSGLKLVYTMKKPPLPEHNAVDQIKSILVDILDMIDMENEIAQAEYVDGGIQFEVKKRLDKVRILFRAKKMFENSKNKIIDPEATVSVPVATIKTTRRTTTPKTPAITTESDIDKLVNGVFNPSSTTTKQPSNSDIDEEFWRIDDEGIKVPPKNKS